MTLSEYPMSTVAFTADSGFIRFMALAKCKNRAGRALITRPVQSITSELAADEVPKLMNEFSPRGVPKRGVLRNL
jgi:hypothetical protein